MIVNRGTVSYFFDSDGKRWRVYDSIGDEQPLGRHRHIFRPGDVQATIRCFAPPDKRAAHYFFPYATDADREVTVERLAEQLRAARIFYRVVYDRSIETAP